MSLPPVPADEVGFSISQSLRLWLQQVAAAVGGMTVTNQTITTTRTIIAETFEGNIDGSNITGNIAYAQLPTGSGTWTAAPTVSGNVALGGTLDVSGLSTFGSHLVPAASETYDLGSETKLWRKGFISQMNATLFAKETQSLYGGWLAVTKNAGTFAAGVVPLATTVDFGQAMTLNQFVLVRAVDRSGVVGSEYMKVGALVTGTTYNVTRDLASTGAKDWPNGTPYAVRGVSGDGWVELNAFDTPRMSVFTQGSAYNNSVENIRIGHLTGMPDSSSGIGAFMGTATSYLRWDGSDLKLKSNHLTVDSNGITMDADATFSAARAYRFTRPSGGFGQAGDVFGLWASSGGSTQYLELENTAVGTGASNDADAEVIIKAAGWDASAVAATPAASLTLKSNGGGLTAVTAAIVARDEFNVTSTASWFSGTITERGRTTPMGEWTTFTPTRSAATGTWTAGTVTTAQYMLVGKTLWVNFSIDSSSNSNATANLMMTLPGGFTAAKQTQAQAFISSGGTGAGGNLFVGASGTQLIIAPIAGGNIAINALTLTVRGQIAIEIV